MRRFDTGKKQLLSKIRFGRAIAKIWAVSQLCVSSYICIDRLRRALNVPLHVN